MKKKRFKLIPAVFLILIKGKKALLLRRFNTGYKDGNYSLVSGHLEGNESYTKALIREAKEEAGIDINTNDLKFVHAMHRLAGKEERIDLYFEARIWKNPIVNNEPDKCDDLGWFEIEKLPVNTIEYVKKVLTEYRKINKYYSEYNWPL